MKRRLRIAGTAFGAFLVPACAGVQPDPLAMQPPGRPSVTSQRTSAAFGSSRSTVAKLPRTVDKFAEGRTEPATAVVQHPLPTNDVPIGTSVPIATSAPAAAEPPKVEAPKSEPVVAAPAPRPDATSPRLAATLPLSLPAADPRKNKPEPTPDAEGVIRANWPVIKGPAAIAEPTPAAPMLPPPGELLAPAKTNDKPAVAPAPAAAPPALPPGVIGTSVHQSNASPASTIPPILPAIGEPALPAPTANHAVNAPDDTPLLRAVRAFQHHKPDEAVECLKGCDPTAQQALLSLMPAVVRLADGNFQQIKPDEMDVILEQLNRVPNLLRSRASLRANNVRLCREVHNFGHVEPFPLGHQFHPGDIVYLYMELANFTCAPDPKAGYTITMASGLEITDAAGQVAWRADLKEIPDTVSSPPQDYYRNFRLCVPALQPGTYTLTVKTIDRPTDREVTTAVELRIGAK